MIVCLEEKENNVMDKVESLMDGEERYVDRLVVSYNEFTDVLMFAPPKSLLHLDRHVNQ